MARARSLRGVLAALAAGLLLASGITVASADVPGGNVLVSWSLPGVPDTGVSNITFPMTVDPSTLHADGTYFADQFDFTNAEDVGYMGLQPRPNVNGHERLHAAFSSFISGSSTSDPQCSNGADGGPGVSCASDLDAVYGDTYALTVSRSGPDTWTGTVTDTVTGIVTHIGTYTLPAGSGNLAGSQAGFVEDYLGVPNCSQTPHIDVTFGGPTSTDAGGLQGTQQAEYEYNGCVGQANYRGTSVGNGTHIIRGFIGNDRGGHAGAITGLGGMCVDNAGSRTANGNPIILWNCTGNPNQQWTARPDGSLTVQGKCMDVTGAGTAAGTLIQLYDCNGTPAQVWQSQSDGSLLNPHSAKCLDDPRWNTRPGTRLEIWNCNGGPNQHWHVP